MKTADFENDFLRTESNAPNNESILFVPRLDIMFTICLEDKILNL